MVVPTVVVVDVLWGGSDVIGVPVSEQETISIAVHVAARTNCPLMVDSSVSLIVRPVCMYCKPLATTLWMDSYAKG